MGEGSEPAGEAAWERAGPSGGSGAIWVGLEGEGRRTNLHLTPLTDLGSVPPWLLLGATGTLEKLGLEGPRPLWGSLQALAQRSISRISFPARTSCCPPAPPRSEPRPIPTGAPPSPRPLSRSAPPSLTFPYVIPENCPPQAPPLASLRNPVGTTPTGESTVPGHALGGANQYPGPALLSSARPLPAQNSCGESEPEFWESRSRSS